MKKSYFMFAVFAVTALVASAQAQSEGRPDGPDPGVARISLIHGDVSMQRGDSGDWVATTLNTPIVRGDTIATTDRARAEIQLDYGNVLRLAGHSEAKIADLSRNRIQVQISQGYANYSEFKGAEAEVEIDTPNVAIRPLQPGRYRVEVNSDAETNVIVREGEAEVSTSDGSTNVKTGDVITIRGTDNAEYKVAEAAGPDDWDNWNSDRDNIIRNSEGVRKTNAYYTGANDLDSYGHWVDVPGYGDVWQPYQTVAWAPYQYGRWVWEPYYGWTWVSYEPWGWAPYHYGRWFVYGSSWYWWPGPVYAAYRPVWSPAFVFFLGFGHHVDFGFGFSSIGWAPVGPFDHFYPWWGRGFNRINVVNITNVNVVNRGVVVPPLGVRGRQAEFSNLHMAFDNARVRSGITTVSAENFGRGTGQFGRGMDVATLRQASVSTGNLGVVPTRESLASSNRGFSSAPAGIRAGANDHFFSRTQAPGSLGNFHDQASRVQDVVRANGGSAQMNTSRNEAGTSGRNEMGANHGFGQQGNASGQGSQGNAEGGRPGWHTFGGNSQRNGGGAPSTSGGTNGRDSGRSFPSQGGGMNSRTEGNNSGGNRDWRPFGSGSQGGSNQGGSTENRGGFGNERNGGMNSGGGMNSRGGMNSGRDTSYRPPLNLSKPIVQQRGSDNSGGYRSNASYGRSGGSSSNSGSSRGNSGGGSRGYSGGNSGGGGHSSGGGGHSSGGGGGGGGHSSGGGHRR